jgi:8-oxo-dGTP diphosphatase
MEKQTKQLTVFVGICIKNKKLLMTQRFDPDCPEAHLKWELPGGKCEFGETPEEAIIREFREETGVAVDAVSLYPLVYTHYWNYRDATQQTFVFVYKCKFLKNLVRQPDKKIRDVQWIPLSNVLKYDLLQGTETILKQTILKK